MLFYIDHAHLTLEVEVPAQIESHPYFDRLQRILTATRPEKIDARLDIVLDDETSMRPDEEFDPRGLHVSMSASGALIFASEHLRGELHSPGRDGEPYQGRFRTVPRMAYIMAAISLLVSAVIIERRMVLLHSSAVDLGHGALVIMGKSGAGKTSAAQVLIERFHGVGELSYDSSIVTVEAGAGDERSTVHVNPSLIDITRGVESSRRDVPVIAIAEISGWGRNELLKLSKMDGLNAVARNLMYWNPGADGFRRILAMLETVVSCTPVYSLYFRKDEGFAQMIDSHIARESIVVGD